MGQMSYSHSFPGANSGISTGNNSYSIETLCSGGKRGKGGKGNGKSKGGKTQSRSYHKGK